MRIDIPAALRSLEQLVGRMAELIEWERLTRQERRPHVPPSFQLPDHFWEDMESMDAWFWNLDSSIHEALGRSDLGISEDQRVLYQRQLLELEERTARLRWTARAIKP